MESVLGLVRHAGNDGLFRAVEMSVLAALAGQPLHLHAEGLRGTGKTTIMRAVRRVLPRIRRVKGCLYNCDPVRPHCPQHDGLRADEITALGDEWVPMPFLEISHSAKIGSAVGSIDLGRLVSPSRPEAALLPGTIPQANRGIIFVDEINRLAETAPELADVLLDVMGTKPGRVQIEETGLPLVELAVQVTVWAASNPDEDPGPLEEIRRQLSDRFDFAVYADRPGDAGVVEQILALGEIPGNGGFRPDRLGVEQFRARMAERSLRLRSVKVPQPVRQQVAELYSRYNLESLRAAQAMQAGLRLTACMEGREEATAEDLARVAMPALRHRVDPDSMKKITAHLAGLNQRTEVTPAPAASQRPRFPTISFGAAAVEPLPAPADAPGEQPEAGPVGQAGGVRWATQHPPRPAAVHEPAVPRPQRQEGWLDRALAGLRRNLGMADLAGRGDSNGGGRQASPSPRGSGPQQPSLAPRAGRLYQKADHQTAPQVADPTKVPPVAPPSPARRLSALDADELIRTEEELNRR